MVGRYDAKGPEAESEPGSRGRVLRNRVGITSVREIERRESEALLAATQATIDETRIDQRFTGEDIRRMHRRWLGEIYVWAGDYRQVNIAKGSSCSRRPVRCLGSCRNSSAGHCVTTRPVGSTQ
jgi:cell filamentation protein